MFLTTRYKDAYIHYTGDEKSVTVVWDDQREHLSKHDNEEDAKEYINRQIKEYNVSHTP